MSKFSKYPHSMFLFSTFAGCDFVPSSSILAVEFLGAYQEESSFYFFRCPPKNFGKWQHLAERRALKVYRDDKDEVWSKWDDEQIFKHPRFSEFYWSDFDRIVRSNIRSKKVLAERFSGYALKVNERLTAEEMAKISEFLGSKAPVAKTV